MPLGPSLWYVGSQLLNDLALSLRLLAGTEWVASVAAYLLLEAQDTRQLRYYPPRVLHALKVLLLQGILGASWFRNLQCYVARMERADWTSVPSEQLTWWSWAAPDYDRLSGRFGQLVIPFESTQLREILRRGSGRNAVVLKHLDSGIPASARHF